MSNENNGRGKGFRITHVWVFAAIDENDEEGVIGELMGGVFMPFVCSDERRFNLLYPRAKMIAAQTNKTVRIIKLTQREVIEEINGNDQRH